MDDSSRVPPASTPRPDGPAHHPHPAPEDGGQTEPLTGGHRGSHRWMMIACCIPMIVLAVALVASGTANAGALIVALVCTLAMALMMGGMGGSSDHHGR